MNHDQLKISISKSQHCQRNWDLTGSIPDKDLDVFIHTVKESPTKQNRVFYKVKFITNRDLIQKLYEITTSQWNYDKWEEITNSQMLGNLIVLFLKDFDHNRDHRTKDEYKGEDSDGNFPIDPIDEAKAVGVCAGYLILISRLLGYETGNYDSRHRQKEFDKVAGGKVLHSVSIGRKDSSKVYNQHHIEDYKYLVYNKDVKTEIVR